MNTVTFRHGRYELRLPRKDTQPILPDNNEANLNRLKNLLKLNEYDAVIRKQIENGIVEGVSESEPRQVGRLHYLPHDCVIRRDKETARLRIVYDVSYK